MYGSLLCCGNSSITKLIICQLRSGLCGDSHVVSSLSPAEVRKGFICANSPGMIRSPTQLPLGEYLWALQQDTVSPRTTHQS